MVPMILSTCGPVALTRPFASSAIAVVIPVAQAPMLNALRTTSGSSPNVYRAKKPIMRRTCRRSSSDRTQL